MRHIRAAAPKRKNTKSLQSGVERPAGQPVAEKSRRKRWKQEPVQNQKDEGSGALHEGNREKTRVRSKRHSKALRTRRLRRLAVRRAETSRGYLESHCAN